MEWMSETSPISKGSLQAYVGRQPILKSVSGERPTFNLIGPEPIGDQLALMGLDVGTTGCKASIFDESGVEIHSAYREYPLICRKPAWAELEPNQVWTKVKESIREATGGTDTVVRSVSVSAQGEAFLPLSKEGKPLYNSIVTPDQRAQEETRYLEETFGRKFLFEKTGMVLFPIYTLNKILWIRENEPRIFEKTAKFLCWEDYVNYKLTGRAAIDHSLANRTLMFDIKKRRWSEEILQQLDLGEDLLAETMPGGEVVGEVTREASRETGMEPGVTVVAGGHDQACGCLGAGVVAEGPLYDVTGTVECLMPAVSSPILTDEMLKGGFGNYCHVVPGKYLILGYNMTAGTVLRWFRDNFAQEVVKEALDASKSVYSLFDEFAESVPPGSEGLLLLPYFMGAATPNWDTHARGTIIGLTLAHGKSHVIRAIMEGITYELRNNLEALKKAGVEAHEIRAVGGGARSTFWCQLKSDVTNVPVVVPRVSEASSLGAAMLAGIGCDTFRDFEEAVERTYQLDRTYTPDPKGAYERGFRLYRELYSGVSGLYPSLSEISP